MSRVNTADRGRVRVRLRGSATRALSIDAIRDMMYYSPTLFADPEIVSIDMTVDEGALEALANEPGLDVELVDD